MSDTMKPGFDAPPSEHKGESAFLCQNVRGKWYEQTLDTSSRYLNSSVLRPQQTCASAQRLTHGSTATCNVGVGATWTTPFWAQDKQQNTTRDDRETRCTRGVASAKGGQYFA
jgi:hypothetical protein